MVEFIKPLICSHYLIDCDLWGFFPPFAPFPPAFNDLDYGVQPPFPAKGSRLLALAEHLDRCIYTAGQMILPPQGWDWMIPKARQELQHPFPAGDRNVGSSKYPIGSELGLQRR